MNEAKRRRVPVLLYHKIGTPPQGVRNPRSWVTLERFAWQMRFLARRGYRGVSPAELAAHYRGERPLVGRPILITFDDGSRTVITRALPVLHALELTATVFVVAGQIGGVATWERNPVHPNDALLTRDELLELHRAGWTIAAHSVTHARLPEIALAEARREIIGSRTRLESTLGIPITTFAYPYGEYRPAHLAMVREAGFEIAFTTNDAEHGLLAVARQTISARAHALRFLWRLRRARRGWVRADADDSTALR